MGNLVLLGLVALLLMLVSCASSQVAQEPAGELAPDQEAVPPTEVGEINNVSIEEAPSNEVELSVPEPEVSSVEPPLPENEFYNETIILYQNKPYTLELGSKKLLFSVYNITSYNKVSFSHHATIITVENLAFLTPCKYLEGGNVTCFGYYHIIGWDQGTRKNITDALSLIIDDEYYDANSIRVTVLFNASVPQNLTYEELDLIDEAYEKVLKNDTNYTFSECYTPEGFSQYEQFHNFSTAWFRMLEQKEFTNITNALSYYTRLPYAKKLVDEFHEEHAYFKNTEVIDILKIVTTIRKEVTCNTNLPEEKKFLTTIMGPEDYYYVTIYDVDTKNGSFYVFTLWEYRNVNYKFPQVGFTVERSFGDWVVRDFFFVPHEFEGKTVGEYIDAAKFAEKGDNETLIYDLYNQTMEVLVNTTHISSKYYSVIEEKLKTYKPDD